MTQDYSGTTPRRRLAPARRALSRTRHSASPVRIFGLDAGPCGLVPPQSAGWAHLVSVRSGAAVLTAGNARIAVVPEAAAWLPAGASYTLDLRTRCELRIVYASAERYGAHPFGTTAPTRLLRELIERLVERGYLDPREPRDARLLGVIDDELLGLAPAQGARILMLPHTPVLRAAVELPAAEPDEPPSIRLRASTAGMSLRSFERHFTRETGLAPREWLRRARLSAVAIALAGGASVTEASLCAGYASLSAFISAYRSVYDTTPGHELRQRASARK